MPRRKKVAEREVLPDPKYNSIVVTKFINGLMERGKKSVAEKIFYNALDQIEDKTGNNGLDTFYKALDNVKPILEREGKLWRFAGLLVMPMGGMKKQWQISFLSN